MLRIGNNGSFEGLECVCPTVWVSPDRINTTIEEEDKKLNCGFLVFKDEFKIAVRVLPLKQVELDSVYISHTVSELLLLKLKTIPEEATFMISLVNDNEIVDLKDITIEIDGQVDFMDVAFHTFVTLGDRIKVDSFYFGTVSSSSCMEQDGKVGRITPQTVINLVPTSMEKQITNPFEFDKKKLIKQLCETLGSFVLPTIERMVDWLVSNNGGAILHGPSGVGKSKFIEVFCKITGLQLVIITPKDIFKSGKGKGESYLMETFFKTRKDKTLILLDQLDVLIPSTLNDSCSSTLLACIDKSISQENLYIVGVTSHLFNVNHNILHPKRLGGVVCKMTPPVGLAERMDLVKLICLHYDKININKEIMNEICKRSNGFLPSDIHAVVQQVALFVEDPNNDDSVLKIVYEAFRFVGANSLKAESFFINNDLEYKSEVSLDQLVGGQTDAKQQLYDNIILPLMYPEKMYQLGIKTPPTGILLHGPSGNGKTLLAKSLGNLLDIKGLANVVSIQCSNLISKVVGESEQSIVSIFQRAKQASPCVLFLDQIDAIAPLRGNDSSSEQTMDRMLSCLLTEMDGIQGKTYDNEKTNFLIVLAATDSIDKLDPAILRPGRFDQHVLVDKPKTFEERREILKIGFESIPFETETEKNETIDKFANTHENYSSAELIGLVREKVMEHLRKDINCKYFHNI